MNRLISLLFIIFLVTTSYGEDKIRFGVFAYIGYEKTKEKFEPLVEYLNTKLTKKVVLEVLTQEEMDRKIREKQLDIVTTNPTHFLVIRNSEKLSGALATEIDFLDGKPTDKVAGVILVNKDSKINSLKDIKNKKIATPSLKHMGGFRAQAYELYLKNIIVEKENHLIITKVHNEAIKQLLSKEADVAFVREGIYEQMIADGELKAEDVKIINEQKYIDFPFKTSTKLYPQWPIFELPHTKEADIKEIISALYSFDPDSTYAKKSHIYGYSLPADYLIVENMARALRLPPYEKIGKIDHEDIWQQHKFDLIGLLVFLVIVLLYNVSTRKKLQMIHEKNLLIQKTQTKFQTLFEESLDGILLMDPHTQQFLEFNHHAFEMYGYTSDEFALLTAKDLETLEDEEQILATQKKILENGWDRFTTKHKTKTGEIKDIIVNVRAIVLDNKDLFHVTFHDITEMRKQAELIEQQKEEFEAIFKYSKDGIAIIDLQSRFLNFNDAYMNITGYRREELLQKSCMELTTPTDRERSKRLLELVIETGYFENFEKTCITNGGKYISVNMSFSLMPDRKRILLVTKDVSSLKLFESQAKLASMGEMIGNISHQWKQPLTAISASSGAMRIHTHLNVLNLEKINTFLDGIDSNVEYLSKTIEVFRNFVTEKKEKARVKFSTRLFVIRSIVGSMLKNNHITYNEILPEIEIEFETIVGELDQVIINIINNAKDILIAKAIENPMIELRGSLVGQKFLITIEDNGGGIPLDAMSKIFEPYFTTKHQSQGTGLGLHMSYKIVTENLQGKIYAANTQRGAKFFIELPLGLVNNGIV